MGPRPSAADRVRPTTALCRNTLQGCFDGRTSHQLPHDAVEEPHRITLGRHLVMRSDDWELQFPGTEMKARKPVEMRVPQVLNYHFARYLDQYRPALLDGSDSDRLWITQYGDAMTEKMVFSRISIATERAFGKPVNPHLFRDCAVTFVALNDPKHIGIAAPILGHTDPRTTERHYIQAQQIAAGIKLQASLRSLRKQTAPFQYRPKDNEDTASIEDQVRSCKDRINAEGGTVAEVYSDAAISGGSMFARNGLRSLLNDPRLGQFDTVVSEALDRLSPDQEDIAGIYKRLTHANVALITLAEGELNLLRLKSKGSVFWSTCGAR